MKTRILSCVIIVVVAVFSVNSMAMEFDLKAWCGGLRWQLFNRTSNDQAPIGTLKQLKKVSSQKPSREFLKFASDLWLLNGTGLASDPMFRAYLQSKMLKVYERVPKVRKGMQALFRIRGIPVTEKGVKPYGSLAVEVSDFPLRRLEYLAQILGPIPEMTQKQVVELTAKLNLKYDGFYVSKKGILIVNTRLHQQGLPALISGEVPGYVAIRIDEFLNPDSSWGSGAPEVYGIIAADYRAYYTALEKLPETILTEGLKVLASVDIADPDLNVWTHLVGDALVEIALEDWKSADDSLKNVHKGNHDLINSIRQFLFEKGLVNYKPTMPRGDEVWRLSRVLKTAKYFRKDKPYYRPAPTQDGIEVFGHLEASAQPIKERDEGAVLIYLRGALSGLYDVSKISVKEEGQFSAIVSRQQ